MPLLTYTFTYDTEAKRAVVAGNIDIRQALRILQELAFSQVDKPVNEEEQVGKEE